MLSPDTKKVKIKLRDVLRQQDISEHFGSSEKGGEQCVPLIETVTQYGGARIEQDKDGILLRISTKKMDVTLNLRRGLAINSLAFASHQMIACVGTLPHGYFSSIALGADYYSGGVVIELPIFGK